MKKIAIAVMALTLVAGLGISGVATAANKENAKITKACKGKKPGEVVKVNGKEVKCPEPKKK